MDESVLVAVTGLYSILGHREGVTEVRYFVIACHAAVFVGLEEEEEDYVQKVRFENIVILTEFRFFSMISIRLSTKFDLKMAP